MWRTTPLQGGWGMMAAWIWTWTWEERDCRISSWTVSTNTGPLEMAIGPTPTCLRQISSRSRQTIHLRRHLPTRPSLRNSSLLPLLSRPCSRCSKVTPKRVHQIRLGLRLLASVTGPLLRSLRHHNSTSVGRIPTSSTRRDRSGGNSSLSKWPDRPLLYCNLA